MFTVQSVPRGGKVALVANGAIHDYPLIASRLEHYSYIVAVDGGLNHCHAMAIAPQLIMGDFDSVLPNLLPQYTAVERHSYACDKDQTDLELAIEALLRGGVLRMTLFGALEKRTDHTLVNLHLLRRYPGQLFIESESERIFALSGTARLETRPGQLLSLIPIGGAVSRVQTEGLRWELRQATLDHQFLSLSNECLGTEVVVTVPQGDLICCLQI